MVIAKLSNDLGGRELTKAIGEKKGFTLIEVLIGLVVLAIGLLAVAGMQATSVRGNLFSNNVMLATYIAQERLEFLKTLPMDSPSLNPLVANFTDGTKFVSTDSFTSVVFRRSYRVSTVVDPRGNYLRIDYSVTWNDGNNRTLALHTLRSQ